MIPIPNVVHKEKMQKLEEPQAEPAAKEDEATEEEPQTELLLIEEPEEEPETESFANEEPEEPPETELTYKEEAESSGCPDEFGYLANRPPNTPIPPQCLVCPRMVDCVLSPREND